MATDVPTHISDTGVFAEELRIGPRCLIFFVDETGHEDFADPNYPVFGLGGCAVISSAADQSINDSWRSMKARFFGGSDVPLHASALKRPTAEQLEALARFFRDQQFARFAVTMSKSLVLPVGLTPFDVAAKTLNNRFADLLSRLSPEPNEVAFLHEASDRCDRLVERHFGGNAVSIAGRTVPVHKGLVRKSAGLPALEVADFVLHAAGRRAAQLHRSQATNPGKDFFAVFYTNPTWNSYIHVTEVVLQDSGAEPSPLITQMIGNDRI